MRQTCDSSVTRWQEGKVSRPHIRAWNPMPGLPGPTYDKRSSFGLKGLSPTLVYKILPDIMSTSGRGIYLCVRVEGLAPPRYHYHSVLSAACLLFHHTRKLGGVLTAALNPIFQSAYGICTHVSAFRTTERTRSSANMIRSHVYNPLYGGM